MFQKLRSLWTRFWLRGSKFSGRYSGLNSLYRIKDPWNLLSDKEQARFRETNNRIRMIAPDCRSILELGCGEGAQTRWLMDITPDVTGVEVSEHAVARARQALPAATFKVGRAEDIATLFPDRRFDLATALEVLYYSDDIPSVIAKAQGLADRLLVTNFSERAERVTAHFTGPGWSRLDDIEAGGTVWQCHYWSRA